MGNEANRVEGLLRIRTEGEKELAAVNAGVQKFRSNVGDTNKALQGYNATSHSSRTGTNALAEMHRLGGERVAKYGTTLGMLSGSLQRVGVQNELVARTSSVFFDLVSGASGPIGIAVMAVGGLAAGVAALINQHREEEQRLIANREQLKQYREAIIEATDAALRLRNSGVGTSGIADLILASNKDALAKLIADTEGQLARIRTSIDTATRYRDQVNRLLGQGDDRVTKGAATAAESELVGMKKAAADLVLTLDSAIAKMEKLTRTPAFGPQLPDEAWQTKLNQMNWEKEQKAADAARERSREQAAGMAMPIPEMPLTAFLGSDRADTRFTPRSSIADLVGAKDPFTQHTQAIRDNSQAYKEWSDQAGFSLVSVLDKHRMLSSGISSLQQTTTTIVQTALMRENWHRLKGVEVAKYAAGMTAAALIGGIRDFAAQKVGMNIAQAVEWGSNPFTAALVPGAIAAAAKWSLVAGVAGGVAGAISSGAQRGFDRSMGQREPNFSAGSGASAGPGGTAAANPSARIVSAGAAPQSVSYAFSISYNAAAVYGNAGTREWFFREIVPLIQEAQRTGQVNWG